MDIGDRTVETERLTVSWPVHRCGSRRPGAWAIRWRCRRARPDRHVGVVGHGLNRAGLPIVLPQPAPARFLAPASGLGNAVGVLCVLVGLRLQQAVAVAALASAAARRLAVEPRLAVLPDAHRRTAQRLDRRPARPERVPARPAADHRPAAFVSSFTHFIAFGDGVDGTNVWTTHVAGHPPLATLVFWLLGRIGLGGGFWAGALCILVVLAASVAIPVTLGELGAGSAAGGSFRSWRSSRAQSGWRCRPTACSPVWLPAAWRWSALAPPVVGSSPACWEVCCSALRVFLSYGLVLFGIVVLTAVALSVRQRGLRPSAGPWLVACAGVAAVAAVHLASGSTGSPGWPSCASATTRGSPASARSPTSSTPTWPPG